MEGWHTPLPCFDRKCPQKCHNLKFCHISSAKSESGPVHTYCLISHLTTALIHLAKIGRLAFDWQPAVVMVIDYWLASTLKEVTVKQKCGGTRATSRSCLASREGQTATNRDGMCLFILSPRDKKRNQQSNWKDQRSVCFKQYWLYD